MKKMKTAVYRTFSTMLLCLSLLVYTMPATSSDHAAMMESHAADMMKMSMDMDHCDKMDAMDQPVGEECCQTMDCDCVCVSLAHVFTISSIQIADNHTKPSVNTVAAINLSPQYSSNPSPPPII